MISGRDAYWAEALDRQSHGSCPCYKLLEKLKRSFISKRQEGLASPAPTHSSMYRYVLSPSKEAPSCQEQPCPLSSSSAVRNHAELSSPALLASPWPFPGPAWGCQDPQQVPGQTWGWREGLGATGQPLAKNRTHRETSSKILLFLIHPTIPLRTVNNSYHLLGSYCLPYTVFDDVRVLST